MIEVLANGIPVARIELLDDVQIDAVNRHSELELDVAPTLFLEFHGTPAGGRGAGARGRARSPAATAREASCGRPTRPSGERLWRARHRAYDAARALRPGAQGFTTDACVPISRLAECIAETKRDLDESGLLAPIVGHVGDGNFHLAILVDPDDPDELRARGRAQRAARAAARSRSAARAPASTASATASRRSSSSSTAPRRSR